MLKKVFAIILTVSMLASLLATLTATASATSDYTTVIYENDFSTAWVTADEWNAQKATGVVETLPNGMGTITKNGGRAGNAKAAFRHYLNNNKEYIETWDNLDINVEFFKYVPESAITSGVLTLSFDVTTKDKAGVTRIKRNDSAIELMLESGKLYVSDEKMGKSVASTIKTDGLVMEDIASGTALNIKMEFDMDNKLAKTYINNVEKKSAEFTKNIENISVELSGAVATFDNLKITLKEANPYVVYATDFSKTYISDSDLVGSKVPDGGVAEVLADGKGTIYKQGGRGGTTTVPTSSGYVGHGLGAGNTEIIRYEPTTAITSGVLSVGYSFEYHNPGGENAKAYGTNIRYNGNKTGDVTGSGKFALTVANGETAGSDGSIFVAEAADEDSKSELTDNTAIVTLTQGETYTIRQEFDADNHTTKTYVNGEFKKAGAFAGSIESIAIDTSGVTQKADNIEITYMPNKVEVPSLTYDSARRSANAIVKNSTSSAKPAVLILGAFEGGILKDVVFKKNETIPAGNTVNLRATLPTTYTWDETTTAPAPAASTYKVKAYVWDSLNTITPLHSDGYVQQ